MDKNRMKDKVTIFILIFALILFAISLENSLSKVDNLEKENMMLTKQNSECYQEGLSFEYICDFQEEYWAFNEPGDYANAIHFFESLDCEIENWEFSSGGEE